MKIEDLKLFIKVVEMGNFSAAANALDLPRANVSRRINDLEKELNSQLFHRTTRTLSLTNNGASYYQEVTDILERLDAANQNVAIDDGIVKGKIKLGLVAESYEWVQPLIFDFQDKYPEVELDLRTVNNAFVDMFRLGLDISFHGGELINSDLIARKLISFNRNLVASPEYLAKYPEIKKLEDLHKHQIICYRWPDGRVDNHWQFEQDEVVVESKLISSSLGFLREALMQGRGIAFMPDLLNFNALKEGSLVKILPDLISLGDHSYLVHPKTNTLNLPSRLLIEHLSHEIPKLAALSA